MGKVHISPPKTVESGPVTVESPFPEPEEKVDTTEAEMSEFEEAETVQMGSETPTVQYTASVTEAPTITPPLRQQPQVTAGGRGRGWRRRPQFQVSVPSSVPSLDIFPTKPRSEITFGEFSGGQVSSGESVTVQGGHRQFPGGHAEFQAGRVSSIGDISEMQGGFVTTAGESEREHYPSEVEVGDSDREPATAVFTQPAQPLPPTSASEEEAVTDTPPLEQLPQVHPTAVASPVRPPPPVPIQILPVVRPPTSAEEEKLDQGVPEFPPVTPAPAVVEPPKKKKKKKRFRRTRPIQEEKTEGKVPEVPPVRPEPVETDVDPPGKKKKKKKTVRPGFNPPQPSSPSSGGSGWTDPRWTTAESETDRPPRRIIEEEHIVYPPRRRPPRQRSESDDIFPTRVRPHVGLTFTEPPRRERERPVELTFSQIQHRRYQRPVSYTHLRAHET